jgi:hypothetical protein
MKKAAVLLLGAALALILTACMKPNGKALESLPTDYGYEDAVADGLVVIKDGDVASGESVWQGFLTSVNNGKKAAVRLAYYYTLDDPSRYAPELYAQIKDDYPKIYVKDLTFDGVQYVIEGYEDGEAVRSAWTHLLKYEGKPTSETALFDSYTYYVLVDDDTLAWDEIMWGMLSSQHDAYIPHFRVYSDLTYK